MCNFWLNKLKLCTVLLAIKYLKNTTFVMYKRALKKIGENTPKEKFQTNGTKLY